MGAADKGEKPEVPRKKVLRPKMKKHLQRSGLSGSRLVAGVVPRYFVRCRGLVRAIDDRKFVLAVVVMNRSLSVWLMVI